jgi:Leucine-rich repeat (LRR) protein
MWHFKQTTKLIKLNFIFAFILPTLLFGQASEFKSVNQALQNVETCEILDLYGQNLNEISADVIQLKHLKELNIGANPNLDIQKTFQLLSQIKTLEILSLEDCKLKSIPKEISLLINLKDLNISGNKLSRLPNEICKLKNLEVLDLYSNNLLHLPKDIHKLKELKYVNCNSNRIRQLPDSISLIKIKTLQLGANSNLDIDQVVSALFFSTSIDTLILYNCNIKNIPTIIYHLRSLKYLDLGGNPYKTVPLELGQLTNLTTLRLTDYVYMKYDEELHRLLPNTKIIR